MWIDVIQMGIILAGLLALTIKGTVDAGGMEEVWRKASDGGRLIFDELALVCFIIQQYKISWSDVTLQHQRRPTHAPHRVVAVDRRLLHDSRSDRHQPGDSAEVLEHPESARSSEVRCGIPVIHQ